MPCRLADGKAHKNDQIVVAAEKAGAIIGAKDKSLYISSILSKEKTRFKPDRRKGWMLKRTKKSEAGDVGASPGL